MYRNNAISPGSFSLFICRPPTLAHALRILLGAGVISLIVNIPVTNADDNSSQAPAYQSADYEYLVHYKCEDGTDGSVRYEQKDDVETATLIAPDGSERTLHLARSGSGVLYTDDSRYSDGTLVWHTKGKNAVGTVEGTDVVSICTEAETELGAASKIQSYKSKHETSSAPASDEEN